MSRCSTSGASRGIQGSELDLIDDLHHGLALLGHGIAIQTTQLVRMAPQGIELRLGELAAAHAIGDIADALTDGAGLPGERTATLFERAGASLRRNGIPCREPVLSAGAATA